MALLPQNADKKHVTIQDCSHAVHFTEQTICPVLSTFAVRMWVHYTSRDLSHHQKMCWHHLPHAGCSIIHNGRKADDATDDCIYPKYHSAYVVGSRCDRQAHITVHEAKAQGAAR